ncbi:MAG: methyl-accepting chemotaxis protein [Chloroflexi bacterium]|nr:methyl-accepting chemotaxis protein [Chloroflexota bacterium]
MTVQERALIWEDVQTWRRQLIQGILRGVVIIGIPAVIVGSLDAYGSGLVWVIPLYVLAYVVAALSTFLRHVPFAVQAGVVLGVIYILAVIDLFSAALTGDALPYLMALPFLAVIFFGRREGVWAIALTTLTMMVFGWVFSIGLLDIPMAKQTSFRDMSRWLSGAAAVLMLGILLVNSLHHLLLRLTEALSESRRLADEEERRLIAERKQREYLQATVAEYLDFVGTVAEGNLNARLSLDNGGRDGDYLVALGLGLNGMTDNLHNVAVQINNVARGLGGTFTEILSAMNQQAAGANQQSAAITQTTTTVDELKTIAEQSVARAQEVVDASQRTVEVSHTGRQAVQDTVGSMVQIKGRVEGIAENILTLSEQTQQIGEIIATVNDIAAQSSILALNASVEAARAGEYGKGFAVVAVEVRNLAEQSRQATAQVKTILSDIQKATNATVMATEEGTKDVEEGVQLAVQAGKAIGQLAGVIEESAQAATQMVAGGRQQVSGVEQVALAMHNINQATVQSLSSTRKTEESAQDLSNLAGSLTDIVKQYKI